MSSTPFLDETNEIDNDKIKDTSNELITTLSKSEFTEKVEGCELKDMGTISTSTTIELEGSCDLKEDVNAETETEANIENINTTTSTSTSSNLSIILNFTGIDFLDSEVADLKEFFEIRTESVPVEADTESLNKHENINFLIKIYLSSINLIREKVENETILLSILVKSVVKENISETIENKSDSKDASELSEDTDVTDNIRSKETNDEKVNESKSEGTTEAAIGIDKGIETPCEPNYLPYRIQELKVELEQNSEEQESESTEHNIKNNNIVAILTDISDNILFNSNSKPSSTMSLLSFIEEFYFELERYNYPSKDVIVRDYYYPIFDSRHWGRFKKNNNNNSGKKSSGSFYHGDNNLNISNYSVESTTINNINSPTSIHSSTNLSYNARALYDFQALMQGELSFQENEVLQVLANLGNGWLTARKVFQDSNTTDDLTGLIPENYIVRI